MAFCFIIIINHTVHTGQIDLLDNSDEEWDRIRR